MLPSIRCHFLPFRSLPSLLRVYVLQPRMVSFRWYDTCKAFHMVYEMRMWCPALLYPIHCLIYRKKLPNTGRRCYAHL
jgi:hypothetical protein